MGEFERDGLRTADELKELGVHLETRGLAGGAALCERGGEEIQILRRRSEELDFGVWWMLGHRQHPRFRVSYVKDTGEFYAMALGEVIILGRIDPAGGYEEAERILEGWGEYCGQPEGLEWVVARLSSRTR